MNIFKCIICLVAVLSWEWGTATAQTVSSSVKQDIVKVSGVTSDSQIGSLPVGNIETTNVYKDGLGRAVQTVALQASPNSNNDIVQVFNYNNLGQQTMSYLPYVDNTGVYPIGGYRSTGIADQGSYYGSNNTSSNPNKVANDSAPYSQQVFENSPFQRVFESGMVGNGFQTSGGTGTQHYKTQNVRSNVPGDNVLQWGNNGTYIGDYGPNVLSVSDITDEDGAETLIFKDVDNHIILKRQLANQTVNNVFETYFDTYCIYNAAGAISYIIPPKAIAMMNVSQSYSISPTAISNLIFSFQYDNRGRLIQKNMPGVAPIYIIYDPMGRPVLEQDGNLRLKNQWSYSKYDYKGHVISQGIYTDNINIATSNQSGQAAMQAYMASSAIVSAYQSSWYETRTNSVATGYYTNTVFPTKNNDGTGSALLDLGYSYYDNYSLTQKVNPDYTYQNQNLSATEGGVQYTEAGATTAPTTGLVTMIRKKTIGAGFNNNYIWLINVVFYDKNLHPIQVQSNNQLNYTAATNTTTEVVTDYMTNLPDFTGKPLVTKVVKNAGAAGTTTILTVATYDTHNERLLYLDQTYNNQPTTRIASYEYNEMGQLVKKNLAPYTGTAISANVALGPANSLTSTSPPTTLTASNSIVISSGPAGSTGAAQSFVVPAGATFSATIIPTALQSVDLRYNIRGQLISINNSTLTNDNGITNNDSNDLFGMQIMYDLPDGALLNAKASYTGKVSGVKWMTVDEKFNKTNERSYTYNYDLLNRLVSANYGERLSGSSANFNLNPDGFDENGITYDENGNLLTLNRNSSSVGASSYTQIDQLVYSYSSLTMPNQLANVSDANNSNSAQYTGYGFYNLTGITTLAATTTHYQYDPNGNLTSDPYKGITIGYNGLNKTDNIQMVTGPKGAVISPGYRFINYTYDASGTLIRKQQYDLGTLVTTTDYIGGFVYLTQGTGTPALSYFPMSEGRVINSAGTSIPEFIIADQQGNARFSFQAQGATGIKIIQENSYYAFGLIMPNSPISMPTLPNKRLYNGGAEWQNDYSNLPDYYQTFYRNYDAGLGRFVGADPMGESASSMTNYQYANNNPISFNDPLGNTSNSASFDGGCDGCTVSNTSGVTTIDVPDPPTGNTGDQGGSGPGGDGYNPFYYYTGPGPKQKAAVRAPTEHYTNFITPNGGLSVTGDSQALDGFSSISLANYDLDNGINAITEASATSASDGLDRTFDISDNDLKSDIWQGMLNSSNAYNPFIGSSATVSSSANANSGGNALFGSTQTLKSGIEYDPLNTVIGTFNLSTYSSVSHSGGEHLLNGNVTTFLNQRGKSTTSDSNVNLFVYHFKITSDIGYEIELGTDSWNINYGLSWEKGLSIGAAVNGHGFDSSYMPNAGGVLLIGAGIVDPELIPVVIKQLATSK
ncbi:DUF6443 domain-containing protein [Mucilaginibacter sp. E4BP6]|uniref:DUF6443 domain-containing protein n=1 Tax=Mucilaginibacter sp. E4BP6 TaxID=2723089 RepID=UPI0015CEB602|nr:DUF6443 domain-containing protein [Mucilaginibacter sp. E4BP6]NYE68565.1 RHS repeat-associated protein [Mucilaginibacter sp. E4BP6]